uniref:Uncharacterized protein n=1 Tax=Cannabis sativa TaxID=3483 RepID=A0A803QS78_CANSA
MFVLYKELGLPQPTPYEISHYFDLRSVPKQNRTGYFYFSQGDDEVPLSRIVWNLEKKERALRQCLASKGPVGDDSLGIGPRGQAFERLTHIVPTSKGKDKAVTKELDSSSSDYNGI